MYQQYLLKRHRAGRHTVVRVQVVVVGGHEVVLVDFLVGFLFVGFLLVSFLLVTIPCSRESSAESHLLYNVRVHSNASFARPAALTVLGLRYIVQPRLRLRLMRLVAVAWNATCPNHQRLGR
jgi:hypothetical protein